MGGGQRQAVHVAFAAFGLRTRTLGNSWDCKDVCALPPRRTFLPAGLSSPPDFPPRPSLVPRRCLDHSAVHAVAVPLTPEHQEDRPTAGGGGAGPSVPGVGAPGRVGAGAARVGAPGASCCRGLSSRRLSQALGGGECRAGQAGPCGGVCAPGALRRARPPFRVCSPNPPAAPRAHCLSRKQDSASVYLVSYPGSKE